MVVRRRVKLLFPAILARAAFPTPGDRDDIEALRSPLFLVLPEGAGRAVRKPHAVRVPPTVPRQTGGDGRAHGVVAVQKVSGARRRWPSGDGGDCHHRISGPLPSWAGLAVADGSARGARGPQHG